jgi:putative inorganic carbon (HCO3(-)) transporter
LTPAPASAPRESFLTQATLIAAAGSTVAVLFSIAASQILLGLAILLLIATRRPPEVPPMWPALALFMLLTVVSLLASGNPAAGLPQVRKFFVYLTLVTVFTTVRRLSRARALALWWAVAASAGAAFALFQFARKMHEAQRAGVAFYDYYLGARVTGFMGHWQTFGGEQMLVLVMVAAFLMFSPSARGRARWLVLAAAGLLGAALLADYTRGLWLGSVCAVVYLVWCWRRLLLLVLPVVAALLLWINPGSVRARVFSVFEPRRGVDSNEFRVLCWRAGAGMIRAHPWLGVGPEMVRLKFQDWIPADVPRPLPTGWYGHLHNVYLHYAAERGIPAMLALVAMLLKMLFDYGRALRRAGPGRSEARFLLQGAIAAVIAIMVSGMFELNFGDSEVLTLFLAVAALGYVAAREVERA